MTGTVAAMSFSYYPVPKPTSLFPASAPVGLGLSVEVRGEKPKMLSPDKLGA